MKLTFTMTLNQRTLFQLNPLLFHYLEKYSHLVLILGGIAKQEDYSELFALINEKIETVVLIGESTRIFSEEIAVSSCKKCKNHG